MNMKKQLIQLLIVVSALLCAGAAAACTIGPKNKKAKEEQPVCDDWIHPDETAYKILGRRLTDILINARQVKVYALAAKDTVNPDDYEVEPHFVRDTLLGKLTAEQAVVLRYNLVSNGANYHRDSTYAIMAPYCPAIEFEFTQKKEVAHIIISPSTFTWAVKYDDKILFKYNYANGTFIRRFCEYFMKKEQSGH